MRKIAILCDFDGTVAREDVGNLLFRTFSANGEAIRVVERWKRGEISSRECLEQEVALAVFTTSALEDFVRERKIDPYFKDFNDFARRRGIEIVILSDGLDYYIERMLMRNGLGGIEFFSNRLCASNGKMTVEFPHYNKLDCTDCGCCKTHHLLRYRERGYYIIYVGDGLSDRCPSESADLVFAKGDLLRHCREREIGHVEFRNFRDVEREVLERLLRNEDFRAASGS